MMVRKLDKVERASNSIAMIDRNNKNVIINTAMGSEKVKAIREEVIFFPNGVHDDTCFVAGTKIKTIKGDKNIEDKTIPDDFIKKYAGEIHGVTVEQKNEDPVKGVKLFFHTSLI